MTKRQPPGSSNGGQFAPDTSGKAGVTSGSTPEGFVSSLATSHGLTEAEAELIAKKVYEEFKRQQEAEEARKAAEDARKAAQEAAYQAEAAEAERVAEAARRAEAAAAKEARKKTAHEEAEAAREAERRTRWDEACRAARRYGGTAREWFEAPVYGD